MPADLRRMERLQIMLSAEELAVIDDFRFRNRMPTRAAAVRELLRRGLGVEGFGLAAAGEQSTSFGVLDRKSATAHKGKEPRDRGETRAGDDDNDES